MKTAQRNHSIALTLTRPSISNRLWLFHVTSLVVLSLATLFLFT